MATLTSDAYLDDAARTAGEAMTLNGAVLTVRTDTRWHANAPASMTGSLGSVTVSATLGGGYFLDGTAVRWLAYDTGSGNVPAIGTNVTQAGVTSSYLLGVWASLTSAPTAVGAAMPASGYLKFREVSGAFAAGALTGIGANATGADVVGWIEVVHDQAANLTFRRLGLGFKTRGDWFELGTTNGSVGQTFQIPTNGGGAATHVPGVYVETGSGTGEYEWWPALITTTGWSNTYIATDARAKLVQSVGDGVIRFGSDGTNNVGYVPASGCKVRIPNVIGRQCDTASRATNAAPHTTLTTRPEFNVASAATVDVDGFIADWYFNINNAYQITLKNMAVDSNMNVQLIPSSLTIDNICIGRIAIPASAVNALYISGCYFGADVANVTTVRHDGVSSGHGIYISSVGGTDTKNFNLNNIKSYANAGASKASNSAIIIYSSSNVVGNILYNINNYFSVQGCNNCIFTGVDYVDCLTGTVNTSATNYGFYVQSSKDTTLDGLTIGLNGTISDVHPYTGIIYTSYNSGGVKIRNMGSKASPVSGGSSNYPGYLARAGSFDVGSEFKRLYLSQTRTRAIYFEGSSKGIIAENVYGTQSQANYAAGSDVQLKNIGGTNTTSSQSAVYGHHVEDFFTSDTVGRLVVCLNAPSEVSADYVTTTFGTGAGWDGAGGAVMPNLTDVIEIEMPYYIIGHTALQNTAPTLTGTNTSNFTIEFQIDVNDGNGWSGSWEALTGAYLSGHNGDIDPAIGFKLKLKITVNSASATNALTYIRIDTDSTASAQEDNLYPLDYATITIGGIESGSAYYIEDDSDQSEILIGVATGDVEASVVYTEDVVVNYIIRQYGYLETTGIGSLTNDGYDLLIAMVADPSISTAGSTVDTWTGMSITWGAVSKDIGDGEGDKPYGIVIDCDSNPLSEVYEWVQRQLEKTSDIDDGAGEHIGIKSANLCTKPGSEFVGAVGVWLDNVPTADALNYIVYDDNGDPHQVPAPPVQLEGTGIEAGSRIQVYDVTGATELDNDIVATSSYSYEYDSGLVGHTLRIRLTWADGDEYKREWTTQVVAGASGCSFLAAQEDWDAVNAWAIDGSAVTEFSADYPNLQVDADDADGETTKTRLGAWWAYNLTTEDGIRYFFGGLEILVANVIKVLADNVDLQIQNISATSLVFTDSDVRLYRDDNNPIVAAGTGSIEIDYNGVPDVVYVSTGSGLSTEEHNQLMAASLEATSQAIKAKTDDLKSAYAWKRTS